MKASRARASALDRRGSPATKASERARAQSNLLALVGALFALTVATVLGVTVAESALAGATHEPAEHHAASAVAEQLVAADSPLTNRTNVLDGGAVTDLTASAFRARYPILDGRSVRVTLGGETLVNDGSPAGGTTMRRLVLVERTDRVTVEPRFSNGNRAVLPRRTDRVDVELRPPENVSVTTVRASGRVVLHEPGDGLSGRYTVPVSRRETVRLAFVANGSLGRGDVRLTLYPRNTTRATLAVTVDD